MPVALIAPAPPQRNLFQIKAAQLTHIWGYRFREYKPQHTGHVAILIQYELGPSHSSNLINLIILQHFNPSKKNSPAWACYYLVGQGLLLHPGLILGFLKNQTQLLLRLRVPAQGCYFSLAGSAGIRLVEFCKLPDNRWWRRSLTSWPLLQCSQRVEVEEGFLFFFVALALYSST